METNNTNFKIGDPVIVDKLIDFDSNTKDRYGQTGVVYGVCESNISSLISIKFTSDNKVVAIYLNYISHYNSETYTNKKYTKMEQFKVNDWIVITQSGFGAYNEDIGLVCKIEAINTGKESKYGYSIKIDRDKKGNNDRYLGPEALRLATPEEIPEVPIINDYQIY